MVVVSKLALERSRKPSATPLESNLSPVDDLPGECCWTRSLWRTCLHAKPVDWCWLIWTASQSSRGESEAKIAKDKNRAYVFSA